MSNYTTQQMTFWQGEFGQEYTERNTLQSQEWDQYYKANYGLSKIEMNSQFIGQLPRTTRILEVGCNIGMQLVGLQRMGFTELYGIELQNYAVEKAKQYSKNINIICGSGFDIPFKDAYFDIVVTNGVLIHIDPKDLPTIMQEMYRCSKKYIWGFEYYSEELLAINYRGYQNRLWKADYAATFKKQFSDLHIIKQEIYPYITDTEKGNRDSMYLLQKTS
ncbi:methyltransferase domain-containing protein [Cytophagaceae bacterium DM2B3-1]|uniref:Methyltransferase domain-containing protein n=1 Tax=Xanthocytophaga flava TaxID=3048013 RepID=A0ABT7CFF0_9BACT|nr:pseudaminic acid biosynthesis-associated methylase [Xanthocytophaga flavus]MDJ1491720.1 methyltransferase domain-containing protein [Xanthocytophaga flavus]